MSLHLLDLFSAINKEKRESVSKVKGLSELNNLECTLNLEATQAKCQHRQGFLGSKNVFSFPLRCSRVFGFLGLLLGFCRS